MPLFLDASSLDEIAKYSKMGILGGVTTNPTIMAHDGIRGVEAAKKRAKDIARALRPLPVSIEIFTDGDRAKMLAQAKEFASLADNINIKITIHGPHGQPVYLDLVNELETKHGIRVNVTAMMSAQQGILAALAGATYVSLFGGRINNMGYDACSEISKLRQFLDDFELKSQIIIGSTREALNVIEWFNAGAHIVTVTPSLIETMLIHPYSKETVQMFLNDAARITGKTGHSKRKR
ncbi:MAG: transaldolase family protein [Elusimicrobiota bacterium]